LNSVRIFPRNADTRTGIAKPLASAAALLWTASALIAFSFSSSAFAQTQSHFAIDPAQSTVQFDLQGSHEVKGAFHISSGDIAFDRSSGQMSGRIVVDAGSGDSGEASRDKKMKSDVLRVPSFPSITFEPATYSGQLAASGTSQIQVKGNFTIIGKPHEITVPMTVQIDGTHCTATGSFNVPYVEWGMKDPSIFILKVGKNVKIDLNLAGQISNGS
jgi:polyisoprenoid-binding protein YceI